ncbi:hypothetical protein [Streptomyces rhizosphaerihabitans]|uniref:hypothetical protein n=1 Tax=Streptomyces rhizosphaerihabitans TaxID=1266770 RepID=UPI0021BEA2E0|nr:hypothetical protein [Streptomyces rhizosphaerihabitans]MCT9010534.1 hypothetical protein [Streptomyces rhizosphaerihabitans]
MTTDTDGSRPQDRSLRELRLVLLLLTLLVGLLITTAAVYVARVHPGLAQPLGVGAAVMSALAAIAGVVARAIRR